VCEFVCELLADEFVLDGLFRSTKTLSLIIWGVFEIPLNSGKSRELVGILEETSRFP
jgi:hypothetical protein